LSFKPVQTVQRPMIASALKYLHSFANWSLFRQHLCINSQTRSPAVARKDALQPI